MSAISQPAEKAPKSTTIGACHLCGSVSCRHWRFAALTEDGHVNQDALYAAHDVKPDVVEHDADGKVTGGATPILPMTSIETTSHKRNKGRVGPLPVKVRR